MTTKKDKKDKVSVRDSKDKILAIVINEIRQKFGDGAIMQMDSARKISVDTISTGSISLDIALGVGGVPRGRIIEIYSATR